MYEYACSSSNTSNKHKNASKVSTGGSGGHLGPPPKTRSGPFAPPPKKKNRLIGVNLFLQFCIIFIDMSVAAMSSG